MCSKAYIVTPCLTFMLFKSKYDNIIIIVVILNKHLYSGFQLTYIIDSDYRNLWQFTNQDSLCMQVNHKVEKLGRMTMIIFLKYSINYFNDCSSVHKTMEQEEIYRIHDDPMFIIQSTYSGLQGWDSFNVSRNHSQQVISKGIA